jgi:predicted Zn-dependent peptidase
VTRPFHFPAVTWAELPGGLKVATVPVKGMPIVHVRVVVGGGQAADGERPGLAAVTADLLGEAGRLGALGADLSIETGFDATTLGLAVTRDRLGEALDQLAATVQRPELTAAALDRVQKREAGRLLLAARTDAAWGASMVLYRDLFSLPSEHHPYATWSPAPDDVQKLTLAECRGFHRRFYVPRNVAVILSGDTAPDMVARVGKAFAGFTGGEAQVLSFTDPVAPEARKITLVDRPGSAGSDVFVGALGPPPSDRSFAALAVASRLLGDATVTELAHGPSVLVAHAHAAATGAGDALQGLLDREGALAGKAEGTDAVDTAARSLTGGLAVRLQTSGDVAGEVARLRALGLPDDHDDALRKELGEITPALALRAAGDAFRAGHEIIVVTGDAAVVGPALARFGEVKVVDPTRGFARVRTLPMDASPPKDTPRQAGR